MCEFHTASSVSPLRDGGRLLGPPLPRPTGEELRKEVSPSPPLDMLCFLKTIFLLFVSHNFISYRDTDHFFRSKRTSHDGNSLAYTQRSESL